MKKTTKKHCIKASNCSVNCHPLKAQSTFEVDQNKAFFPPPKQNSNILNTFYKVCAHVKTPFAISMNLTRNCNGHNETNKRLSRVVNLLLWALRDLMFPKHIRQAVQEGEKCYDYPSNT